MPLTFASDVVRLGDAIPDDVDAVVVGLSPEDVDNPPAPFDRLALDAAGFGGKVGDTAVVTADGRAVIAVGLGDTVPGVAEIRALGGYSVRAAAKLTSVAIDLAGSISGDHPADVVAGALVEGAILGGYAFTTHKSAEDTAPTLSAVTVVAPDVAAEVADRAAAVASGVALARDLVNEPGGSLTPSELADRASALAGGGLTVEVWDKDRLIEERCGGLLAVNQGSTEPPRLIKMTWEPPGGAESTLVFVGKGITFDSGGLSLKTGEGMMTMKCDMGGSAAVVGAMSAMAALAPNTRVVGIVCATDNMPSGSAIRPGDVFTARNGKTVEVLNTDAEGRLVLADGLSLASEMEPDGIVDLATLTGACMVALGSDIAGLMGNNEEMIGRVQSAAADSGEQVWHLPLPAAYRKLLDSDTADMRNIGKGRYGGALTAGLFLQEFVGDTPWVHLDIAGPVTTEAATGDLSPFGTGFGVRTLLRLAAG